MKIIIPFLVLVVLNTQALSCALCALMVPTAHVFLNFTTDDNYIKSIDVGWYFSENFTNIIKDTYDLNANLKLDPSELEEVNEAMLAYVRDRNFLMSFETYDMPDSKTINLDGEFVNAVTKYIDDRLVFQFSKNINLELLENRVIKVMANDPEGYFNFTFLNSGNKNINENMYASFNSNLGASFAVFEKGQVRQSKQITLSQALKDSNIDAKNNQTFIERYTINSLENLKALFTSSANELNLALITSIIFISFVYGFFHAAGPGHAKVLTTSFFMANGGNYLKSLWFALKIGFFHVAGAFLLVLVSMFVIDVVANSLSANTIVLATKISSLIIILVAIFMFVDKVKSISSATFHHQGCGCSFCANKSDVEKNSSSLILNSNLNVPKNVKNIKFNIKNSSLKNKNLTQNEWFIALSSAIIPCPGTILVFLLAFNVGSYAVAFMSAIFMAFGMASVIFIAAVFGSQINKLTSSKFQNLKIYVEFLGLAFMLTIGVFMFMISDKLGVL